MRMRMGVYLLLLAIGFSHRSWAVEEIIEDAVVEDESTHTLTPVETSGTTAVALTMSREKRITTRIFWISTFEFSPEKQLTVTGPLSVLQNNTTLRSGRLELNAMASTKTSEQLFYRVDLQGQYVPDQAEDASAEVRLNELFVDYHPVPGWSLLAGKYRRIYGTGLFYNPMDRYSPASFLPGQNLQRLGTYLIQTTWNNNLDATWISDIALTAAFLPGFLQDKYGLPAQEIDYAQFGSRGGTYKLSRTWSQADLGGFIRGYANVAQGDLTAMAYYYESQWQWGAAYNKYLWSPWLEVHAEGLLYQKPHDLEELADGPQWDGLAGIRVEPYNQGGLVLEYLHWSERLDNVPIGSGDQQRLLNNYLKPGTHLTPSMPFKNYVAATVYGTPITDLLTLRANAIVHLGSGDCLWTLRSDWIISDKATLAVTGLWVQGTEGGYYQSVFAFPWRATLELYVYL